MPKFSTPLFFLSLLLATTFFSCKKSEDSYTTENLIPLLKANLSIDDLSEDSMFSSRPGDSLVHLVYDAEIYNYNLADELVEIPDTFLSEKFTLDSIRFPNQRFIYQVSLGNIAKQMATSGDPTNALVGQLLIQAHGNSGPIPAVNDLTNISEVIPTSNYFDRLELSRGELQMWLINNFPVDINDIGFVAKDASSGVVIFSDTIPLLPAGDSIYKVYNLAGKTLEGDLDFELTSINTPGSVGSVLIDTSDFLRLETFMTNLRAREATAVFPNIELVALTEEVTTDLEGAELTYVEVEEGQLHVFITSSVDEAAFLTYTLEGAYDKQGQPLSVTRRVSAAPPGGLSTIDEYFDISGSSISLTGRNGNKFNTYTQTISARIDSSGQLQTLTSDDSLVIRYELINIKPKYLKGYAGRQQISIGPESSDFDFFENMGNGQLSFETINLDFVIENYLGVGGALKVNRIEGFNGGQSVVLTSPTFSQNFAVSPASEFPLKASSTRIPLNNANSNIQDLINLRPKRLEYEIDLDINPGGNDGNYQDFAYFDKGLEVRLDMDMPLSIQASNLILQDTLDFDLASTIEDLNSVDSGALYLIAYNGYPVEGDLDLIILDENYRPIDTLMRTERIQPGPVDANCKVYESSRTKITNKVDRIRLDLLKGAKFAIVKADFSTSASNPNCTSQYLKIYREYELEVKLTARFTYRMGDIF